MLEEHFISFKNDIKRIICYLFPMWMFDYGICTGSRLE